MALPTIEEALEQQRARLARLRAEVKPPKAIAAKSQAIPRDQWPAYAEALLKFATPADTGLGDVVARNLGVFGETFKAVFKKITGKDCGCGDRQERLNKLYPIAEISG